MAKKIDSELCTIQNLFKNSQESILGNNGKYIIPEYQRAYNWKFNEQCDKLWQDIITFINTDKNETYFLGSIIINNDDGLLYIIDGQQRTSTFILLLKALLIKISQLLSAMSDSEDNQKIKNALKNRKREILSSLYFIDDDDVDFVTDVSKCDIKYENRSMNEEHKTEMSTILKGDSLSNIEYNVKKIEKKQKDNKYTNFYKNFRFFYNELDKFDSTALNDIAKQFLQQCQVIVVVSYQTEEAIEIFNSLNSTGMPLADADIISAKLYSNYGTDKTKFKDDWSQIVEKANILTANKVSTIDDILNQYMYIIRASKDEKDTSMPGVRKYFTNMHEELLSSPRTFIADMSKIIDIWQDEDISPELFTLRQLLFKNNANFKFFYASYFYFYFNETEEQKQLYVRSLLKLFILLSIKEYGYSSSKFKPFLIGLNMYMGRGYSTDKLVEEINDYIEKEFSEDDIYNSIIESAPNNGLIYLNEYLFAKENNMPFSLDVSKIEIEHIMPSSGKNISAIRDDAKLSEDEFKLYANKLGNKILLEKSINGYVSNDWFKTKKQTSVKDKKGYKDSEFPIALSLVSYCRDTWDKNDIEIATRKAAKRITNFIFNN